MSTGRERYKAGTPKYKFQAHPFDLRSPPIGRYRTSIDNWLIFVKPYFIRGMRDAALPSSQCWGEYLGGERGKPSTLGRSAQRGGGPSPSGCYAIYFWVNRLGLGFDRSGNDGERIGRTRYRRTIADFPYRLEPSRHSSLGLHWPLYGVRLRKSLPEVLPTPAKVGMAPERMRGIGQRIRQNGHETGQLIKP